MYFLGSLTLSGFAQPNSLDTTSEATYAEHPIIQGKPAMQRTGDKADTMTLGFSLHRSIVQPETFIHKLRDLQSSGEVLPLATEAGDAMGEWVIATVNVSHTHSGPDGSIIAATVSIGLIEWVTTDGAAQRTVAARNSGFAVGAQGVTDPPLTQAVEFQAMQSAMAVGSGTQAIDTSLTAAATNPDLEVHVRKTTRERLAKLLSDANFARDTINSFGGAKYTDTRDMESDLAAIISGATTMQGVVDSASISDLRGLVNDLKVLDGAMRRSAQALQKYTGSRN